MTAPPAASAAPSHDERAEPTVEEIVVADPPEAWGSVGFSVEGEHCRVGTVRLRLAGPGATSGIVRWSVRELATTALDGLPTDRSTAPLAAAASRHPNGAVAIDHVVAFSPVLDRTVNALEAAGLKLRRLREGPTPGGAMRQAFFRLGEVVLEVIEQPTAEGAPPDPSLPARLWGLAVRVDDLADCASRLGDLLGQPRDAVQPGRRIATLRRSAGLSVPLAFITPPERGGGPPRA